MEFQQLFSVVLSDSSATFLWPCLLWFTWNNSEPSVGFGASPPPVSLFSSPFVRILNSTASQDRLISLHCRSCTVFCTFYFLLVTSSSLRRATSLLFRTWHLAMHPLSSKKPLLCVQDMSLLMLKSLQIWQKGFKIGFAKWNHLIFRAEALVKQGSINWLQAFCGF